MNGGAIEDAGIIAGLYLPEKIRIFDKKLVVLARVNNQYNYEILALVSINLADYSVRTTKGVPG